MPKIQTCGYSHRKNGACEMTTMYALTPPQTQLLHDLIEAFDCILDNDAEARVAAVVKRWA